MPPNPPQIPPELVEQLNELGIDPNVLIEGGGGGGSGFDVFMGEIGVDQRVATQYRPPPPPPGVGGRPGASPPGLGGQIGAPQPGGMQYSTVGQLLQRFYRMSSSHMRRIQALLYAGGFYGDMDVTDVRWGEADEDSFAAWAQLIQRTARFNAAGEDITYTQVLDRAAESAGLDPETFNDVFRSGDDAALEDYLDSETGQGDLIQIMLSDPNALRATADRAATAALGRRANPAEQQMIISVIHDIQRRGQTAIQRGQATATLGGDYSGSVDVPSELGLGNDFPTAGDSVVEYAAPDEAATAEALLRQQNPGEAGAHDVAIQYANLLQMLGAPVDVPRLTV